MPLNALPSLALPPVIVLIDAWSEEHFQRPRSKKLRPRSLRPDSQVIRENFSGKELLAEHSLVAGTPVVAEVTARVNRQALVLSWSVGLAPPVNFNLKMLISVSGLLLFCVGIGGMKLAASVWETESEEWPPVILESR